MLMLSRQVGRRHSVQTNFSDETFVINSVHYLFNLNC